MRAKQRFPEWSHDHETERGYLRRMEARCEPGGNSPGSHSTTVYTWLCYASIQQASRFLFTWGCVSFTSTKVRIWLTFFYDFTNKTCSAYGLYVILACGVADTIMKQYQILKYRYSALTHGQAESPADSTLYPPNSGGGQGHSAQFASSGTRGLWVSHAEQKVIKYLVSK